jgi:ribosomal protein S6--L-glutamate ligase
MRIAFLLQRTQPNDPTPRINPVTDEVIACLRARGVHVDLLVPENDPVVLGEFQSLHDLYVLKSKTPLALSLAGALAMAGAITLNTVESCNLARDKIVCTALLAWRGVPVPPSWATGQPSKLPHLWEGPLWIKPQRGSKGRGVVRVESPAELGLLKPLWDPFGLPLPLFAQAEVPFEGDVLKVYVVGDRAWAVSKPWPVRTLEDKNGRRAFLPPDIEAAAIACGHALGLEIYGVDVLVRGDAFYVVDVNAFPGFRGPPEGPACIADYIYERAYERAMRFDGRGPHRLQHVTSLTGGPFTPLPWLVDRAEPRAEATKVGAPT